MIRLVIAAENQGYVQALSQYLQKAHGQAFETVCFTQLEILQNYLMEGQIADILLIDSVLNREELYAEKVKSVLILTENKNEINSTAIYKYQNAERIVEQLLEFVDKHTNIQLNKSKEEDARKFICIYSPAGASGKTTVAYNLAHQYAMQSLRVLFISLETYSTLPIFNNHVNTKGIIYLLHLIKNNHSNIPLKLNVVKLTDSSTSIHFIQRESNVLEYKDIEIEDIDCLTEFLKNDNSYDVVILDLDSTINEIALGAFKACDAIINLVGNHSCIYKKWEDFNKQVPKINEFLKLDITEKLINIINNTSAVENNSYSTNSGCTVQLEIPYIDYSGIKIGDYYPEMAYYKQLHDILDNFFQQGRR